MIKVGEQEMELQVHVGHDTARTREPRCNSVDSRLHVIRFSPRFHVPYPGRTVYEDRTIAVRLRKIRTGCGQGILSEWWIRKAKTGPVILQGIQITMPIGRVTQVVDCREAMGMGKGGGIAQRGTISECRYPDVIVVGMSPGRRHVTKPVCDITSALRQQGDRVQYQHTRAERRKRCARPMHRISAVACSVHISA